MKSTVYASVGFLYGVILTFMWFVSVGGGGAGHGPEHETNIILFFAAAPYGLGLVIWPVIGFLSGNARLARYKTTIVGLLAAHYAGLIHHCYQYAAHLWPVANGDKSMTQGDARQAFAMTDQEYVWWATAIYLTGQACIWLSFMKAVAGKKERAM